MCDGPPVDTLARVYIQRVPNFVAAPTALTPAERCVFRELRWWLVDEIAGSRETFIPRTLAVLLSALLNGPWPAEPIMIVPYVSCAMIPLLQGIALVTFGPLQILLYGCL